MILTSDQKVLLLDVGLQRGVSDVLMMVNSPDFKYDEACISRDNRYCAAICSDHVLRVYLVKTTALCHSFPFAEGSPITSPTFSPDSKYLIFLQQGHLCCHALDTGKLQHELDPGRSDSVLLQFSLDQKALIMFGGGDFLRVWDYPGFQVRYTLESLNSSGSPLNIYSVDGHDVCVLFGRRFSQGKVVLFIKDQKYMGTTEEEDNYSPNGYGLETDAKGKVKAVWLARTRDPTEQEEKNKALVEQFAREVVMKRVIPPTSAGEIKMEEVKVLKDKSWEAQETLSNIAMSTNAMYVAADVTKTRETTKILLWTVKTGRVRVIKPAFKQCDNLYFSPDGRFLLQEYNTIALVYSTETLEQ